MLLKLSGGRIYDPINGIDGEVRDLFVRDGRVTAPPGAQARVDREIDVTGKVVMPGGIDLHTHIGGGKVNLARAMLPEDHLEHPVARSAHTRSGSGAIVPSTWATGYRYARMGYTAVFDPAVVPVNARQAHFEAADTPMVDTGGYAMLGNDDFLLRLIAEGAEQPVIDSYVGWMLHATQCVGVKAVNPGGISAFKFNQRKLDLDERNSHYGVSPRAIIQTLARALSNLGVPGNFRSTLETIDAAEGLPIHLAHVQFHSYGSEGDAGFSSAASQIAEAVNAHRNVTVDVGQVMFGQTVTTSGDTMRQYANHVHAHPRKWSAMDIECEAGCGVVPFRYRDERFVNALQWAIGLELFLLIDDPWRVMLTTDHPNGAPFTTYPHLIRLLSDAAYRRDALERLHPEAARASALASIDREYSLYELAIATRAAPARLLGLSDHGHLGEGALGDIAVYEETPDRERMFERPALVLKNGELVVEEGRIVRTVGGSVQTVRPGFDPAIERRLREYLERYLDMRLDHYRIRDEELEAAGHVPVVVPLRA
ncbi:MAG: formylmethanofuran dehydrogenase subunit A [Gammaproteobacteria bacterium]|nr:formylmethanofuran dehydrogenase subunit A [Gammaproteobacteria bacterium]